MVNINKCPIKDGWEEFWIEQMAWYEEGRLFCEKALKEIKEEKINDNN